MPRSFDIDLQHPAKNEHQHQKLCERVDQRPQNTEDRPAVAELDVARDQFAEQVARVDPAAVHDRFNDSSILACGMPRLTG